MRRCSLFTLLLFFILAAVTHLAYSDEPEALVLESDIQIPAGLWEMDIVTEDDVPTTVITPPEPLTPPPLESISLMLDWYISPQHAPILLAKARGHFQQQGLEVQLQSPGDPSLPTKLLAAGDIDLALARQSLLHLSVHQGAALVRIATLIETPLNAVITLAEHVNNQRDMDALKRMHYGFTTHEGERLIIPDLATERVATESVATESETSSMPENLHFDAMRALATQQVQAVADGFFHTLPAQLENDGFEPKVIHFETFSIPRHDGLIVLANRQSLNKRSDTWINFVIAVEEAAHWMISDPELAWETLIDAYPVLNNDINAATWEDVLRRISLSPAALDTRRYRAFETYLHQRGISDAPLAIEQLAIDPHNQ